MRGPLLTVILVAATLVVQVSARSPKERFFLLKEGPQTFAAMNHAAIIAAKEVADQAMFPDRPIFTPSWDLPVDPGNSNTTETYNGTIQHAMMQMNETYPGWIKKFDDHVAAQQADPLAPAKREYLCQWDQWKMDVRCNEDPIGGRWDALGAGVRYLHGLSGKSYMRAGPHACGRISCSYDTAIFTCNENDHSILTPDSAVLIQFKDELLVLMNGNRFQCDSMPVFIGLIIDVDRRWKSGHILAFIPSSRIVGEHL
ncbi:hypothetical protein FKW77_002435 [Venturia effusa]|uniref:SCP domain-containing protein n=1 Tax=Venturia effusa TaxID=50376 RepID=A0A517LJS2_9PEZI|nr:hypothetical protein FKW77_002435 [Venturia effusa]